MQYLVTGADGFIGREIVSQLAHNGEHVRAFVHTEWKTYVPQIPGVQIVCGNLMDPSSIRALFSDIDPAHTVVIHTAAIISVRKKDKACEEINRTGTKNILDACLSHKIRRFIHFASVDALSPESGDNLVIEPTFFDPTLLPTSYGRSKAQGAQLVLDAIHDGLDATILLPSAVIGPGDYRFGFISTMLKLYLSGIPRLSVRGGYEFVDVRDVASAAIAAAKIKACQPCYILSSAYADVTTVFNILASHTGRKPVRRTLPLGILYPVLPLVAFGYRVMQKQPPLTLPALRLMKAHPSYCHARAAGDLGFSPRPLTQSIEDAADFILSLKK